MEVLIVLIVLGLVCGGFGAYAATAKGRSPLEGFLFGAFLGPLGVVVVALLPAAEPEPRDDRRARRLESWPARVEGRQPPPPDKPSRTDDLDELAAFDAITRDMPKKPRKGESATMDLDAIRRGALADPDELRSSEERAIGEAFGRKRGEPK